MGKAILAEFLKPKSKEFDLFYSYKYISHNNKNTFHSTTNYNQSKLINRIDDNIIEIV